MIGNKDSVGIDFKRLTITSLVFGFLLIPIHELGHVTADWLTGHPAAMSYARDYLLSGGATPFFGLLGGPLLPILVSAVAVFNIYRGKSLSASYPIAFLAAIERLVPYIAGILPSDEKDLATLAGWPPYSFKHLFLALELLLLCLIITSFFKHRLGIRQSILILVVASISLVLSAGFGIMVVERFVFPAQFNIQFGGG
jgi:hypothetical protein